jgi:preprotein translocase subunit SecB
MRPSKLLLKQYVVTELTVTANRDFEPDKPVELGLEDLVSDPECDVSEENAREWQITLRMKHSQNTESNSPYFFMIELVGFFGVEDGVPDEMIAEFVRVNGSSVLYSTAREVLRSIMTMGPFLPIMLPTVCFYDPKKQAADD